MKHLYRAGLLLIAVITIAFVIPRIAPIPSAIVNFGFHKSDHAASALQWAALPVSYAESSACQRCHPQEYNQWTQSNHKAAACENCHGPAQTHQVTGTPPLPTVDKSRDLCATCHAKLDARPDGFPQVDVSTHGGTAACVTCHNPHEPIGSTPAIPHTTDGLSNCLSCHSVGGVWPFPEGHTGRTADQCQGCHHLSAAFGTPKSTDAAAQH